MPGATPQSTRAVTLWALARGSRAKGSSGKKGDVDDALAGLEDGLKGPVAHESRDRAEDQVESGDEAADILRPGQVGPQGSHAADLRQPGQGFCVDVDGRDFEKRIGGQIRGHGAADQGRRRER